jgi:hypothetical protein
MRDNHYVRNKVIELRSETGRALTQCALWLSVAYTGVASLLIGLMRLIYREGASQAALTWMLVGGALAAFAWRRAYRVLDQAEAAPAMPGPGQAGLPATANTSGLTTFVGAPEA